MSTRPVYLVTSAEQPALGADDRLLHRALVSAGVPVHVAVWTDTTVDWTRAAACVLRSVWDYHLRPDAFRSWLAAASAVTTVLNAPALVTWNLHKRYLLELAARGVPTIETVWITRGTHVELAAVLAERGWPAALVKPAVSASAWKTAKAKARDPAGQCLVEDILQHTDVMVQPYLDSIERDGEISVIAVTGELTHAARRPSTLIGDIEATRRGQRHVIADEERHLAVDVLALLPAVPLYARIDLVRDGSGQLRLGELELIEPVLYLHHGPRAVQRLVTELAYYTADAPTERRQGVGSRTRRGSPTRDTRGQETTMSEHTIVPIEIPDAAREPAAYVQALTDTLGNRDPLQVYTATVAAIDDLCATVSPAQWHVPLADGEWTAAQIIGHLLDVDVVYGFRWRLALTEDNPAYPGYNEKLWSELPRPEPTEVLAALRGLRTANIALLHGIETRDWQRGGIHAEQGPEKFDLMVAKVAGHDLAHLNQLARTLAVALHAVPGNRAV